MIKDYINFINESQSDDKYEEIYQNIYDIFIDFKDDYHIDIQMLPNPSDNSTSFQKDAYKRFLNSIRRDFKEKVIMFTFTFEVPENVLVYIKDIEPLIERISKYLETEGYKKRYWTRKSTMSRYDSIWFRYNEFIK